MKSLVKRFFVAIITFEAKMLLKRTRPLIIAVTGSVGKTATKDAIYAVLKDHVHVRKSQKTYNSDVGVPLSVLGLSNPATNVFLWIKRSIEGLFIALHPGDYPAVLVLEMGIDRPKDMEKLAAWVKPDVAVLTRFPDVPVHVEHFASPEAVIEEKMKLVDALSPEGVIVYNRDDERIVQAVENYPQRSISFSRYARASFTGASETVVQEGGVPAGFEFVVNSNDSSVVVRVNGSVGLQHVYSYTGAIAVGSLFDITPKDAAAALREHETPPGRMKLIRGEKNTMIIDDTYNSSPIACEQALSTLGLMKSAKRRIAVLGDMLELGPYSVEEHKRIGALVKGNADILITVGVRARGFAEGAMNAGMDEANIYQYESAHRAARELEVQLLQEGDVVLVKASQGIRAERIVEEIMAKPLKAEDLLVRQDAFWKKR